MGLRRRSSHTTRVVAAVLLAAACGVPVTVAFANACAQRCYAQHNQCRIATKGSPSCDAQLTSCLRSCSARK